MHIFPLSAVIIGLALLLVAAVNIVRDCRRGMASTDDPQLRGFILGTTIAVLFGFPVLIGLIVFLAIKWMP